jgi:cysteine desulfurase family protein
MIYLDNAATSWPKPETVYRAMDRFARESAGNPGRSGHRLALEAERVLLRARSRVAALIGAESPDRIVFTLNGTDALNIAIHGLDWKEGDAVVAGELEHNSVHRPLFRLRGRGIRVLRARAGSGGFVEPDELRRSIAPGTRLVALSHASNVIGAVAPLEEYGRIVRESGAHFLVDAAQTAGVAPLDVRRAGADLVAFPGHKNLLGPMGTGILYVRSGLNLAFFREGGTGSQSQSESHPQEMPTRLEAGTPNASGIAGLEAGLEWIERQGLENIRRHESCLALAFLDRIRSNPRIEAFSGRIPERQLGPVSIRVRGAESEEISAILDQKFQIATRAGLHCAPGAHRHLGTFPGGTVRLSFGYFNTMQDVEQAAAALNEISTAYD